MFGAFRGTHILNELKALRYSQFKKPKISFFGIVYVSKLEVEVGGANVITRETREG